MTHKHIDKALNNLITVPIQVNTPETKTETVKQPEIVLNHTLKPVKKERYLPKPKKFTKPEEKAFFLKVLRENNGKIIPTAVILNVAKSTLYRTMNEDKQVALEVQEIREKHRLVLLESLEGLSENFATIPGNVTERIFQLNALHPEKYRPRANSSNVTNIQINTTALRIEDREDLYE